jgi:glycosyltransferase involved in cell wall biosynthesis
MTRLILDISTAMGWTGPATGIVRVEQELARHAMRRRPDIILAVHDLARDCLLPVAPAWRETLLGPDAVIDSATQDFRRGRTAWRNLLSWRYPALMALERRRLTGTPLVRALAGCAQAVVLRLRRSRAPFIDRRGNRCSVVTSDMAFGAPLALGPADVVLAGGAGWQHAGASLAGLQRRQGFRLAAMCYDLLPLTHAAFFRPGEIPPFRQYWQAMLPAVSLIICNSRCVAADVRDYAAAQGLAVREPTVLSLGYRPRSAGTMPALRAPLVAGKYALFVSTIEPRKGHAVLLDAWRRLLAAGVPQQSGFRLVFAGRRGWMVDDVLGALDSPALAASVLHIQDADDADLERLYHDAAFCVFPSRYEGFGLPIIEAFAHGKAVLASTGGAVPEVVAGLSPCLDPLDAAAWAGALGDWIAKPAEVAAWEARIAASFRAPSWPDAAEAIFQTAAGAVASGGDQVCPL